MVHIDAMTLEGRLFQLARNGPVEELARQLDAHPDKLLAREKPYGWTLLHAAAGDGPPAVVDLLLRRGIDPNVREPGDNTVPMHWAAASGRLEVVRRLADAGSDLVGEGDDHQFTIIGWASCWDGCDDDAHREVVAFLRSRGAPHTIFSALALGLTGEVRRIVARDPSTLEQPLSRNESRQRPLHFAVKRNQPDMVALLIELGADPVSRDDAGNRPAVYATAPGADRPVMERLRALDALDLLAAVSLGDWSAAQRLLPPDPGEGTLHLLAKRGDVRGARWLLQHGADPSARWAHWQAIVTPLHLAVLGDHADVVRLLLAAGADPNVADSEHDSTPLGWAEFFGHLEQVQILRAHV